MVFISQYPYIGIEVYWKIGLLSMRPGVVSSREMCSFPCMDTVVSTHFRIFESYSFDSILKLWHSHAMEWNVQYDPVFLAELAEIERQSGSSVVREEIAALALLLRRFGPSLRRPHCDTLKGSKHSNMKELRFTLPDGEWRVAFAFDTRRAAILLVAGSKSGVNERQFYRQLIRTADGRFDMHLQALQQGKGK
jgi:hypothetical protein